MRKPVICWLLSVVWLCAITTPALAADKDVREADYGGDIVLRCVPYYFQKDKVVTFTLNGRPLEDGEAGMRQALDRVQRMPVGGSLLTGPNPQFFLSGPRNAKISAPTAFPDLWWQLEETVKQRKLAHSWLGYDSIHEIPESRAELSTARTATPNAPSLYFDWRNFPTADTPPEHVVYLIDGRYVGMGERGIAELLRRVKALPPRAQLTYPRYMLHPKASVEEEDRKQLNSRDLLPFPNHQVALEQLILQQQLQINRPSQIYWPKPAYDDQVDEDQPLTYYSTMLRFATIIRDGKQPSPAKISLSWKWDQAREDEGYKPLTTTMTNKAAYFVNGMAVGKGIEGFVAALGKIKTCQAGDVVRIERACIRTTAPFACGLFAAKHRHFETTGIEPFQGLVDLLADVVERQRLRVELIPDESEPNRTANLNGR